MRLLALALGLAACSSPAAKPTTPPPPPDDPPIDFGPCLAPFIDLVGPQGAVLHMCEVDDPVSCFDVEPTGRVTSVDGDVDPPTFELDGNAVNRCASSAGDGCSSFDVPVAPGWTLDDAAYGPRDLLVVAVQAGADGDASPGRVEVWDPSTSTKLASADVDTWALDHRSYLVDFVGDQILVVIDGDAAGSEGSLWRLDAGQLTHVIDLPDGPTDWVTVDATHAAFSFGSTIRIADLGDGHEVASVDWSEVLAREETPEAAELYLYDGAVAGTFAIAVDEYEDGPLAGLGVVDAEGHVTRYPVNVCPTFGIGD